MSLFAVRSSLLKDPGANPAEFIQRTSRSASATASAEWQSSVWTHSNRQLVSVFESESPPDVPDGEVMRVVEVSPDEFLPIANELDPSLAADPVAQEQGQLVVIRRGVTGWTEEDLRSAALRAMMCSFEYPELTWVRTYWAPEQGTTVCLFKVKDHEQAREHSRRSRIPCDEVLDAVMFTPS